MLPACRAAPQRPVVAEVYVDALVFPEPSISSNAAAESMSSDLETIALERSIYRSKVERARAAPLEAKLFAGAVLFDRVRERMLCGIRSQFPSWSKAEVEAECSHRLAVRRKRGESRVYTPVDPATDR